MITRLARVIGTRRMVTGDNDSREVIFLPDRAESRRRRVMLRRVVAHRSDQAGSVGSQHVVLATNVDNRRGSR
jgi:hypothetical protein